MTLTLPRLKIGEPIKYEGLTVFPLFGENGGGGVPYALSDEAIASETVAVTEISEGGSVPDLLVENKGDTRVLFLEGEELVGAKQNRVLNVTVLIAAHAKTPIPVSCVEQGRWGYSSRTFGSSGSSSPSSLRHILKKSVSDSLKASGGHRSDQGAVWKEVRRKQRSLGTASPSSALADTYRDYESEIGRFRDVLQPVDGAVGMAVAVGGKVVSIDLLDNPKTCAKVWNRLLTGFILDALEPGSGGNQASTEDAEAILASINGLTWEPVETVGEGLDFRAEAEKMVASALTFDGKVIHASVSVAG